MDVVEAEPFVHGKKGTRRETDDDWGDQVELEVCSSISRRCEIVVET
jgi:hypothetical protein